MKKKLFIVISLLQMYCFAQPPNIQYTSPHNYTIGNVIVPLTPSNIGGVVPNSIYAQVTTFAGSGLAGSVNGIGMDASFSSPFGIAVDNSGNVFTDNSDFKIRKITPLGVVSTFAGSGSMGSTNGTGTAASFVNTHGIGVDTSSNLYISDWGNNKIRKITSLGVVTDFAGSGITGSTDGLNVIASFSSPTGLGVDANGNVYVADTSNNKIRKITPTGNVSTFAGSGILGESDGSPTIARFTYPIGIVVGTSGNIFKNLKK